MHEHDAAVSGLRGPDAPVSLLHRLVPTSPWSPLGLLYNVLGSGVVALFLSAVKAPAVGTFLGAGLAAIVTAYVLAPGRYQWLRIVSAAALAFLVPFVIVTVGDLILGHSITNPDRSTTYSVPGEDEPKPTGGGSPTEPKAPPAIQVNPNPVGCGQVAVGLSAPCGELTVQSTGQVPLKVTHVDVPTSADFIVHDAGCIGAVLVPGETCSFLVTFAPAAEGERTAIFVIHQNIPAPDRGTAVQLSGLGGPAGPISAEPVPGGPGGEGEPAGEAGGS